MSRSPRKLLHRALGVLERSPEARAELVTALGTYNVQALERVRAELARIVERLDPPRVDRFPPI